MDTCCSARNRADEEGLSTARSLSPVRSPQPLQSVARYQDHDANLEEQGSLLEQKIEANLEKKFQTKLSEWLNTQMIALVNQVRIFEAKVTAYEAKQQSLESRMLQWCQQVRELDIHRHMGNPNPSSAPALELPSSVGPISTPRIIENGAHVNASVDVAQSRERIEKLEKSVAGILNTLASLDLVKLTDLSNLDLKGLQSASVTVSQSKPQLLESNGDATQLAPVSTTEKPIAMVDSSGLEVHPHIHKLRNDHEELKVAVKTLESGHEKIKHIYAHLPSFVEGLTDIDTDKMVTQDPAQLSRQKTHVTSLKVEYDRVFDPSIWDALHFWGIPGVNATITAFITLGFVTTVFSQAMFCYAILEGGTEKSAFLSDQYPSLDEVAQWRLDSGHSIEMLDSITGKSLVRRVCDQDQSLPYSGTYQQLRSDLQSYLRGSIGTMLCSAVIFVWTLTIVQSFSPVVSGWVSVFMIQRLDHTKIIVSPDPRYSYQLVAFTRMRCIAMFITHSLRGAVVLIIGITGALWLANTKSLINLILNTSALSLILAIDQLVYVTFLPKKIKCLMNVVQPLELPHKLFQGVFYSLFQVLAILIFTLVFLVWNVIPGQQILEDKETYLCAGNLNFVYTRHHATNTLYAASTLEKANEEMQKIYEISIGELMQATNEAKLTSTKVQITPNFGKVVLVHTENMKAYTEAFMTYGPHCHDFDRNNFQMYTVRSLVGASPTASCQDMKAFCDVGDMHLLRLMCPVTCDCINARHGLLFRALSEGCPMKLCRETPAYNASVMSWSCTDMTLTELNADPGWSKYFTLLEGWQWQDAYLPAVKGLVKEMRASGCAGIEPALHSNLHVNFCTGSEASASRPGIGSLRAFCPITCNCSVQPTWAFYDCPSECMADHIAGILSHLNHSH